MRVIAGSAKRLLLKTIKGNATRPTTDKIKETLFNMLAPYIEKTVFLDVFAGSGAIGIEALSRGARHAIFIEQSTQACACINQNLAHTKLADRANLIKGNAMIVLDRLGATHVDIVFMDPPYQKGLAESCLEILYAKDYIDENTLIIIEEDIHTDINHLTNKWSVDKIKEYKSNKHIYLHKK